MADTCCEYEFGELTVNADDVMNGDGDGLVLDQEGGVTGLDGAPIRSQVDPRGQTDGGIVHTKHFGPRTIVFKGVVKIGSVENRQSEEYRDALMAVEAATIAALEAELNTESPLTWTPSGLGPHTIDASYGTEGGEIQFSGPMLDPEFTFTLIASDPTIAS